MRVIDFRDASCRHCYKCVRHCEVKAISVVNEQAHIMKDHCINCGHCLEVCPQNAKTFASDMERVADEAARQSQELLMIEYLGAFVGQAFSAVVSGVAAYGLYVRLDCTAEGLLPVRALGAEYFAFDPVAYTLVGQESGKRYRLGQRVAVVLAAADPAASSLEFALAGGPSW